jgi:hypothetical protein
MFLLSLVASALIALGGDWGRGRPTTPAPSGIDAPYGFGLDPG